MADRIVGLVEILDPSFLDARAQLSALVTPRYLSTGLGIEMVLQFVRFVFDAYPLEKLQIETHSVNHRPTVAWRPKAPTPRPYRPDLGRFLSTDPVEGGCANAHVYVFGDPFNKNDLTGRWSWNPLDWDTNCQAYAFAAVGAVVIVGGSLAAVATVGPEVQLSR